MAGDFAGNVFHDVNANGINESGEDGLAGWTVFVDANRDGRLNAGEPSTVTDSRGKFLITGLPAGSTVVYEIVQPGYSPSPGFTDHQTINIRDNRENKTDFPNVTSVVSHGDVVGTAYEDLNLNGIQEAGEDGLAGWTMFVDANRDGILNTGEISTTTDTDGDYVLVSVPTGTAAIVEIPRDGYGPISSVSSGLFPLEGAVTSRQVNVIASGTVTADFPNTLISVGTIQGNVWNDANGDGVRQATEVPLSGRPVFIDLNSDGIQNATEPVRTTDSAGAYSFVNIRSGSYLIKESMATGYISAVGRSNVVNIFVPNASTITVDFFNLIAVLGSIRGTVFSDVNSDGVLTAPEPGISGWQVFVDINGNGILEATEPQAITDIFGSYLFPDLAYGLTTIRAVPRTGYTSTSPVSLTTVLLNGENREGVNFGNHDPSDFSFSGVVFHDQNRDGIRDPLEVGLSGVTVFIDANNNNVLDVGEPSAVSSVDLFYTPSVNEIGTYSFTHLARGTYHVVEILPATLSGTPIAQRDRYVTLGPESPTDVHFANQFRQNEIHGVVFDDTNANREYDSNEYARPGVSIYIDTDRDDLYDEGEPRTVTGDDGSYSFTGLTPGAYIVREDHSGSSGHNHTYPNTGGGTLWPTGISNPSIGNVSPTSITTSLADGQRYSQTVSLTLPGSGTLTNLVDVFLLFDDTGSFTSNSPIVRAAFPTIISSLQASLPGIDLGFGVGRLEEYGSFAAEYATGRPFILNQPIVGASTPGFTTAIQSALDRVAPGYGGDQPETDIEALYQLVTGVGFDGNANGSVLESGRAGLASTQISPGISGDVPNFASYVADTANGGLPAAGNVGGGGFRAGALPVVLLATDTGFAYQPKGETSISGIGGLTLAVSSLTQVSRASTPFGSGAGIQETVTGLNALGALVIGLGTNAVSTTDPRRALEALSNLTGAVNRSTSTITNGTTDPIAPGDPLYFQIGTGFGSTVADGVVNAIRNGVTNVAMDITVRASDPRVRLINRTGTLTGIGAGQTASFDIEFVGDGRPHRFDIEFIRAGTNVVLGSIPVVIGTPITGDGYSYDELEDGEIHHSSHFGNYIANVAPSFTSGPNVAVLEDAGVQTVSAWATNIIAGPTNESRQTVDFIVTHNNPALFSEAPSISPNGLLRFTPAPNANGQSTVVVRLHDNGGVGLSGADTSAPVTFTISVAPVNDVPSAVGENYETNADTTLRVTANGVLQNDSDIDADLLTAVLMTPPSHGTVRLELDGSFEYTPSPGYGGFDSFTYVASDSSSVSNSATVNIKIIGGNFAPTSTNDSYSMSEDATLTIGAPGVLANDSDLDGDVLTALLVVGPAHGSVVLNGNGSFTYTPAANYVGGDSFSYKANDSKVDSGLATVQISVAQVNDAPTATNDSYAASEDTPLNIASPGVLANDADVDGNPLQTVLVTAPTHGTLTLSPTGGFVYTPAANYNGPDSFTYRSTDTLLNSNVATVAIAVAAVNDVPVAVNESYSTNQNSLLTVPARGVLINDTDVDGEPLTSVLATAPSRGSVTLNADGSFIYTPNLDFSGLDTFTYRASDATSSATATVSITVVPVVAPVKFFVVDQDRAANFKYSASGSAISNAALNRSDSKPRGIASNSAGTIQWVIDDGGSVFVYDNNGALLGQWQPQNVGRPEGITVWGNDLWLVDPRLDRVFKFTGGAAVRTGRINATSSFPLNSGNLNAMDVVTDGTRLWVVNDLVGSDKVFRYNVSGTLEGSWTLPSTNPSPTGITIDPNNINHIWIVDSSVDRVFQYDSGTSVLSGSLSPSMSFALAATNTNPQGIADPMDASGSASTRVAHNFIYPKDVDDDGSVTPLDALIVVNQLNRVDGPDDSSRRFGDVDDDSRLTPLDALMVINDINSRSSSVPGASQPILQASTIRSQTTNVRARVELEVEGIETELKIRVDNAPSMASLSVKLNDIALGQLVTDGRGRGEIVLSQGDDNRSHLPLPQGLLSLSPDMELIIGDIVRGTLTQVAKVEQNTPTPSNSQRLTAQFRGSDGAAGSVEYEREMENFVTKTKFKAEIEHALLNTSYEVRVAGVLIGSVTTDRRGKGKLIWSTSPKDSTELPIPTSFPSVVAGTEVQIGTSVSNLA
ncbi:MAG: Ig-like domain-containing protein [Pirellula sp.]